MFASQPRFHFWLLAAAAILFPTNPMQAREQEEVKVQIQEVQPMVKTEQLMCDAFAGISGFGIPKEEEDLIVQCGGAPTYGEALYETIKIILDDVPQELKDGGKFVDLGSGTGKVCFQAYLDYPFAQVIGIELSQKRFDTSLDIYELLQERGLLAKDRTLKFICEDFTKSKLKGTTVIYMCSTCYSNELMDILAEKISKLEPGMQVITLKAFPNPEKYRLTLIREYKLPMTWSKDTGGSPVHVYELQPKAKKEKKVKKEKKEKKPKKGKKNKEVVEAKSVEREDKH